MFNVMSPKSGLTAGDGLKYWNNKLGCKKTSLIKILHFDHAFGAGVLRSVIRFPIPEKGGRSFRSGRLFMGAQTRFKYPRNQTIPNQIKVEAPLNAQKVVLPTLF